jgi:beta-N-acetylhexosaminidase
VAGHAAGARPAGATASPPALTLEDKLAQMLIVMLKGTEVTPALEARLRETPVGGVILYAGNVVSREQLQRFSAQLTAALPIAPLIAVDQEGGPVSRLRPPLLAALPGHMALGATRDAALAREAASVQARELLRLGLNTNFAPVLDLAHPRNAPIGVRAFSDDPGLVSSLGRAWIEGQQEAGVVTFAKHFPGHGDSEVDSHVKLPVLDLGAAELEPQLRVWRGALAGGLDGIMMAHVALPRLDADGLPASLSSAVIDGLLRSKLGYDGVVMTDALAMISVQERLALGPAAVASARAGADMLMVPEYAAKAVLRQLADAVRAGTLAPEKVDAAVERVLRLKRRRGLQPARAASPAPGAGTAAGDARARRIEEVVDAVARGAVTLLRREAGSFPLEPQQRVLFATTDEDLEPPTQDAAGTETMLFAPGPAPTPAERARLCAAAARADAIVVAGGPAGLAELVAAARACSRPLVVLATGTPWAAGAIAEPATVLLLYSSSRPSVKAAFDVIFGREQARGAAPVRDVR